MINTGSTNAPVCLVAMALALTAVLQASSAGAQQPRDILIPPGFDTVWHGVYLPYTDTIRSAEITTFEAEANRPVGAFLMYLGWYVNAWADVQRQLAVLDPMGIKVMVTWEPNLAGGGDPLAAILNGSQDAIINDFAQKATTWGRPFFFRVGHEMNGNWYAWSGAKTGRDPQKYIAAWQYLWNRFQAAGATNAVWVWSPNADSVPNEAWNDHNNYYPGDAYVDWVGVDFYGLKWGAQPPGPAIDKVYADYGAIKPIMIGETAAADCNNYAPGVTLTKDQWITNFFADVAARPNVRAFFWFNVVKEADWRITSCNAPTSQLAYQSGVVNSKYMTRIQPEDPLPGVVDVWSPAEGAELAGMQTFQAVFGAMPVTSYRMYWQIPGDALNVMSDSTSGSSHKEALVDLSGWTWLGRGPYAINVVAQDLNGTALGETLVNIYVTQRPAAPTNLTASAASSSQINLTWTDAASNETGYRIERCAGSGCTNVAQVAQAGANVASYSDAGLGASTTYNYRVRATNAAGDSAYSNTVTATTAAAPATGAVSIWWPAAGTPVAGTSAFKARLEGYALSSYRMSWQVDGDRLTLMYDSTVGGPHKEALVDVSGWTWRGNGPYVINVVARNSKGRTIAQKSVSITVAR